MVKIRGLIMAGAACALVLSGAAGAAASASALAAPWPSQVARPAAASCPRGEKLLAPTGGKTDSLGITHLTYQADPGLVANIPREGLTASQVTPAVMADLGMRVGRSTSPSGRRHLVQEVIKLGRNRTAPEFCWSRPDPSKAVFKGDPTPINDHVYRGNWAGYAVTEAEYGGGINGVTGSWTVPQSMTSSAPSAESTWVGIGGGLGEGSSTSGLIQAGTEMQTGEGYRTFWEYIGTSGCVNEFCGQYSSVNAVRPGDSVTADVWWDTTTTATFLLETSSGGGEWDISNRSVNIPYDHTSAEWIDEWSGDGYFDSPGTVHFAGQGLTSSFSGQGSFTSPFAGSFEAVIMYSATTTGTSCSDGDVISYPADAANGSGGGTSEIVTCSRSGIDSP
jgi:hypothetical protein